MQPGTYMAAAASAVVISKTLNWMKMGGPLAWVVGLIGGCVSFAISRVAYCIGYGAFNRGCDINWSPYPWDAFISATVR